MHRRHAVLLVTIIVVFTFALHSVSTLLSLLVEDAALDVVQFSELPAIDSAVNSSLPQLIPKIIHQTYVNTSVPERWRHAQKTCVELHPDYEYKFWSDEDNLAFIEKEYPWFIETFVKYPHNIQRADAIRYFILAHYGGVYIDLDNGCRRRVDPLLQFPAWLHLTVPTGISNDCMGAMRQHPFFLHVIDQLQKYDRSWVLPYVTVMSTTGPLFLSVVWKKYMALHLKERVDWKGRVRVLTPEQYYLRDSSFFQVYGGSSWHGGDARLFLWMGQHWLFVTFVGCALAAFVGFSFWWASGRMFQHRKSGDHGSPEREGPYSRHRRGFRPLQWRAWNLRNNKPSYEVVEQHVT